MKLYRLKSQLLNNFEQVTLLKKPSTCLLSKDNSVVPWTVQTSEKENNLHSFGYFSNIKLYSLLVFIYCTWCKFKICKSPNVIRPLDFESVSYCWPIAFVQLLQTRFIS